MAHKVNNALAFSAERLLTAEHYEYIRIEDEREGDLLAALVTHNASASYMDAESYAAAQQVIDKYTPRLNRAILDKEGK